MDRCSTREAVQVSATIMEIWGGMVVGVDGLHNSIPDKREEAIEVTAPE